MYYEEQWVDGALCWRTSPDGAWTRYTANELAHRYESAEKRASDAQATVEALQAVIRQMGEQAAVLAKDGMAAKAQVEALQRVRDEFERERDQLHAALMEAKAALDAEREKVKGLHEITKVICTHCCEPMEIPSKAVLQTQLTQLQALVRALQARVRELEQPVYVCQGCGRLGRNGWLPTSFTSDELRGSVQCPDCRCIDREKNTARELAAICTKAQSELAQRTAELEALQRERDEWRSNAVAQEARANDLERDCKDLLSDIDGERAKVGDLLKKIAYWEKRHRTYRELAEENMNLKSDELSALQGLVRALQRERDAILKAINDST